MTPEEIRTAERARHCTIEIITSPEDEGPAGFFASGDDDQDRETVEAILSEVEAGNDWAWCAVEVRATCDFTGETGSDFLGGCSYRDREDFLSGGYAESMVNAAIDALDAARRDLEDRIEAMRAAL